MKTWELLQKDKVLWDQYFVRETVYKVIREFFSERGFHEVETPSLIFYPPAESYVEVFETTLLDRGRQKTRAFLTTSPEVALKKLLVAGIGNCFSIAKSFRNTETNSQLHNPEFTLLEWYREQADYRVIMSEVEDLVFSLHHAIHGMSSPYLTYKGVRVNVAPPWERLSVTEAFSRYAHVDFDQFLREEQATKIARAKGYVVSESNTWEELYNQIFLNEVEPHLGRNKPTILYDFPGSLAALAKKKEDDPRFAERFEFYIAGIELGDCYSELTNPEEQKLRFDMEMKEIVRLGKTEYDYDHDFIKALSLGLPECSGIAVGLDRLVMLFAGVDSIAETMFFPLTDLLEG